MQHMTYKVEIFISFENKRSFLDVGDIELN